MTESFDIKVLIDAMRKENPNEVIFIEKSNNKRFRLDPEDEVGATHSFLLIQNKFRDVAINPDHIMSIFTKGDL